MINEPRPELEPHIARLNGELLCTEKGKKERRKVDKKEGGQFYYCLKDYMHWPEEEKCCAH